MPGKAGRSGPQGTQEGRIAGTNSRRALKQTGAQIIAGALGTSGVSQLSYLRGVDGERSRFRTPERREFLEGSPYVNDWRTWVTPDGESRRVDYGLFAFLADCCRTFIEANNLSEGGDNGIASLPQPDYMGGEYFDVLCWTAAHWQTERLLFLDKSRRMVMSWLLRCCDFWDVLYHPGRRLFVLSEDLEKSEELVYRTKFLYENIPADRISRNCLPRMETVKADSASGRNDILGRVTIRHDEHEPGQMESFVAAVPKNDDMRGLGAARVTIEEAASQKTLEHKLAGLLGTMQGRPSEDGTYSGGQIVFITTPDAAAYAAEIVLDKIGTE